MKLNLLSLVFSLAIFIQNPGVLYSQGKSILPEQDIPTIKSPATITPDFTVVDTQGDTLNLYKTLAEGKTVVLDFFYTTCSYCIQYAPVIEQAYQSHGAGTGDIVFWGLDYGNTNAQVDAYKSAQNITNPCASGLEGNANLAISYYVSAFNFTGYPTYTVICPNKTVHWDVNYPPTATGFNTYFSQCGATGMEEAVKQSKPGISKIYPVPVSDNLNVELIIKSSSPVSLEVYDLLGIKVIEKRVDQMNKGSHSLKINLGELRSGTYFLKMIQDKQLLDIRKFNKVD